MPCICLQGVQNNGSFYLYAYVVRSGKPLDRKVAGFDPDSIAVKQHGEPLDTLPPLCIQTHTNVSPQPPHTWPYL